MPLPSVVQTTDTFNTWFDATNNLISHVSNTSAYVLVNNVSTGNVTVNGALQTVTFVATSNVSLGGTTLASGVLKLTATGSGANTVTLTGDNLAFSMTNTVMSGTDLTINPNTVFQSSLTINGVATLTKNTTVLTGVLVLTSNASENVATVGTNQHLKINANSTVSTVTTNSTVFTANATNIAFTATNLTIAPNTVFTGTLKLQNSTFVTMNVTNAVFTINGLSTFNGNTVFDTRVNALSTLGVSGNVTLDSRLTVTGNATFSNTVAVTGAATLSNTVAVTGNATFLGTTSVNALSANGGVGTSGQFLTSNGSTIYWSTLSVVDANSSTSGLVNTAAQTFAGNKTFQNTTSFSNTLAVTGAATLSNTLAVTGAITITTGIMNANTSTGISANGKMTFNTTNGRFVLPVGVDKWAL